MKKNVVREGTEVQKLQQQVMELERRLAEAQAAMQAQASQPVGAEERPAPLAHEERLQHALMVVPHPLMIRREDGQVIFINKAWTRITGYNLEDIPTIEEWTRKAYGLQGPQLQALITREGLSQDGVKHWGEFEITTRTGDKRTWDFSTVPLGVDPQGRALVMSMAVDVTERNETEKALRQSEAKFARTFQSNPAGMTMTRISDARYTDVNASFCEMVGYRREQMIGRTTTEMGFFTKAEQEVVMTQFHTEGRVHNQELDVVTRNGIIRRVLFSLDRIEVDGEPSILTTMIDITDRKKAEEALAESERRQRETMRLLELDQARLAAVLRYLPVGVWITDQQGRLTGSNPAADRIWAGEAPLLNNIEEYPKYVAWHPESGELLKPEEYPVAAALRTGELIEPIELQIRRFDGSEGTVLASAAPIKDGWGKLMGIVGVNVDITERKQAEEALLKSEERFAKAFHASPDAIIISRMSDGLIMEVNRGWTTIFGHTPEEVLGRTSIDLGIYLNVEDRREMINRLKQHGGLRNFEIRVRRKTGEIRQVSMAAEPIVINHVDCLLTVIQDITERKQAEQALLESARRLSRAQEIAHLGSWELDLVNNRLNWSDEVYRIFGLRPQEFGATYEAFLEAVHPEDRAAVDNAYSSSIREGRDVYEIEHRVVKRSTGEIRIVREKCEHFRDHSGTIVRSIGMVHDITEWKQAEQAVRESEARFHSLADSMPQLVWTALPDGTVDYYNSRYREYGEIKKGEGETWQWAPVLHPDDLQPTVDAWQHALQTGEVYQIEHRVRLADGSYRWHLSRGVPVLREDGQIARWFGTATDIHDLKIAQEQLKDYADRLERSNRELEQFAFMASHDLQEPLRKIEMFGDLLGQRAACLDDHERNYLERMQSAAARMRDMVAGLLQLSRVSTQAKPFIPVNLSEIVSEVLADLESQIRRTGGSVNVRDLPWIEGDPLQLRQLLQNLIGNALKFHKPDVPPQVQVYAKSLDGKIQLIVEDQGIGFSQEDAERIFQPFIRLVGRSQYEGSGIGLAICRRIVERHAGNISAVSTLGQGTTYIVTLPLHHTESAKSG